MTGSALVTPTTGPPPRRAERLFLLASIGLFAVLIAWAMVAPLDVVSNAEGEVVPATRLKAVQHLEGGIIQEILVEEGAFVKKGAPLIRLDPIRALAESDELRARLAGLKVDAARLRAEIQGAETVVISPDLEATVPDLVTQARAVFETRRKRFSHDVKTQEDLVSQREDDVREINQRVANAQKTLDIVTSEVEISANLLRSDLTSRMAHLEFLRQEQTLKSQIEGDRNVLPRAQAALREAREHLGSIKETFIEQGRTELATAQQQIDELSQRALKFENVQERTVLRAPVDGIVKSLSVTTEGGVIQPGQTVAEIVPVEDRLIIEAELPIQDISYVHAGQAVRVTLVSPEAAAFGHLDGRVIQVSPDATVVTGAGAGSGTRPYYKVRIETGQNHFTVGTWDYRLYPGMQVLCSIRVGTRSVFEYLASPWFRSLRFAFQER